MFKKIWDAIFTVTPPRVDGQITDAVTLNMKKAVKEKIAAKSGDAPRPQIGRAHV